MGNRLARPWIVALAIAAVVAVLAGLWHYFGRGGPPEPASVSAGRDAPTVPGTLAYVGSQACAACHAAQFALWQGSQHALAMQAADERTVLGDFSGARFAHDGVTSEFFRRDGRFFVRTDGPDGRLAEFEVRHTFGVYPLQQYLVELPGGRLQAFTIAWDARSKDAGGQRWFHLYPNERIDHRDELHWTRRQQNWNFMCADCHSTDVHKNYDAASDSYSTTWSEVSVGCEACHGPGSVHLELARAAAQHDREMDKSGLTVAFDERRGVAWAIDPATGNAARSTPRTTSRELDACAQCHSRRGQFSNGYRAGELLQDHYLPSLLVAPLYHPDGQQRGEVYDWGSFLSSRMHEKGVTCGDCHDPHDGRLRADGNAVCGQCHLAVKYDATGHHFHTPGSAGSACTSCHMATETYMVIDPRHDHSLRVPRPDLSASLGVPNACNQCHADRGAQWAAAEIRERYPDPKPGFQGFAEAFDLADRGDRAASIALVQIAANLEESAIARASAIERLALRPDENALIAAEAGLADSSPLVRRAAVGVFAGLSPPQRRALIPLLGDPVRSVRMHAARALAPLRDDAFDELSLAQLRTAADEYVAAERFNADRPEHRTNLGSFYAERGDAESAEAELRAALALDRGFVPAWVNLADLMRMLERETDADATLREGLGVAPESAALHHALGLSLVRQRHKAEALEELKRATELEPGNERFRYVYDVARREIGTDAAAR